MHISGTRDLDTNIIPGTEGEDKQERGHHETEPQRHARTETILYFDDDGDEDDMHDDAMEFHFGLRLHGRAVVYASYHNYPGVNQARELQTPAVLVRQLEQHPQNRILTVDDARLCGPNLPI